MASPKKYVRKPSEARANEPGELDLSEIAGEVQTGWLLASSLPDEFVGWLNGLEEREDKRGQTCLFVTITVEGKGDTIIKYTKTQRKMLEACLQKLGYKPGEVHSFLWKRFAGSRGFPRHYPVKVIE
jgi:hypothetical protein